MLRSHIILNDFELLMTFGSIGIHESHMKLNGPKKKFRTRLPESGKSSTCMTSRVHYWIQRVRGYNIIGLIISRELVLSTPPTCLPHTVKTPHPLTTPLRHRLSRFQPQQHEDRYCILGGAKSDRPRRGCLYGSGHRGGSGFTGHPGRSSPLLVGFFDLARNGRPGRHDG